MPLLRLVKAHPSTALVALASLNVALSLTATSTARAAASEPERLEDTQESVPPSASASEPSPNETPAGEPSPNEPSVSATAPTIASEPKSTPPAEVAPEPTEPSKPSDADPTPEVIVLGSTSAQTPGSLHVLSNRQLARFEYDDPHAALLQVPGVYIRQEDGIGLRPNIGIRGANPDRSKKITLMEDGVLFGPAPYSAPAAYFFPLLTRMTEVRIIKGPSAIAHGPQTVGGAIDFVSRPIPSGTRGSVDLGMGDYGYQKAHVHFGTSNERFGFLIEGVRLGNTGFAQLPSGADTGSTRDEWLAKFSYLLDPNAAVTNEFQAKVGYSGETSNETYLGLTDAEFRENPYRRHPASALDQMKLHRTNLSLTHVLDDPRSALTIRTTVYRNDMSRSWNKLNRLGGASVASVLQNPDDPANFGYLGVLRGDVDTGSTADLLFIGPNARDFISQGVQSRLEKGFVTGPFEHRFESGIRLHNDEIQRNHTETAYAMQQGELVYANGPVLTSASNLARTHAAAVFVSDSIRFQDLRVTPGIRAEFIHMTTRDYRTNAASENAVTAFMPGAGAYYEAAANLGVLAGVYRGFSPPAPGTAGARPESSVNYEFGARYAKKRARVEAIGFYNDYENLTDVCSLASGCVTENLDRQFDAGRAKIYGLEVFGTHEFELPLDLSLPLSLAYTYSQGQFSTSFQSVDPIYGTVQAGDEIPYLPPHQLNATVALEHEYGGVNAAFNYVARMREVAGSGALVETLSTDEQLWLDVGAYARPLPWLSIYANVRNLTEAQNLVSRRPYGARVNAPRWFQIGVKATF